MPQNQDEMVSVQVAPRRSIHHRQNKGDQMRIFKHPESLEVKRSEIARLLSQGFIVDPDEKKLTDAEIAAADPSAYLPGANDVKISEDTNQKIISGKRGARAA